LTFKELIAHRLELNLIRQEFLFVVGIVMSSLNLSPEQEFPDDRGSDVGRESSESRPSLDLRPSDLTLVVANYQSLTLRSLLSGSDDNSVTKRIISNQRELLLQHKLSENYSGPQKCYLEDLSQDHTINSSFMTSNESSLLSTAALSDLFRKYQQSIHQMQKELLLLAEDPQSSEADLQTILSARTELANEAYDPAVRLKDYIDSLHSNFQSWLQHLSRVLQFLENENNYFHDSDSLSHHLGKVCSWSEWKDSVNEFDAALWSLNIPCASPEVDSFVNNSMMTSQSHDDITDILLRATHLLETQTIDQVLDFSLSADTIHARKQKYLKLMEGIFLSSPPSSSGDHTHTPPTLLQQRQTVLSSIQAELIATSVSHPLFLQQMGVICSRGRGFLSLFYNKIKFNEMNVSELQVEVNQWIELINKLRTREDGSVSLKDYCHSLIDENEVNEIKLIELEGLRIDAKSELEKMSFKLTRMKRRRGLLSTDYSITHLENSLSQNVSMTEHNVEKFRLKMKLWYRNVRPFASSVAPELYFYLPDLLWSGSLLGDGGFAEFGKLSKRSLTEYEDLVPLLTTAGTSSTSRHILVRGKHHEKVIVLKGFEMITQRSYLEREIQVLGNLRSEFIISPLAMVDDPKNDQSGRIDVYSQYRGIIFLEFPFFASGNLKNWRLSCDRSPWDLQSVARQLFYGLMYLHDHNIIHAVSFT
jgi:hypothetical protein